MSAAIPVPVCTLAFKVTPNAPRTEVTGRVGSAIKIKLHAPPVDGRANAALVEFLAETLGVPRGAVALVRGETSRQKRVRVTGLTQAEAEARLLRAG